MPGAGTAGDGPPRMSVALDTPPAKRVVAAEFSGAFAPDAAASVAAASAAIAVASVAGLLSGTSSEAGGAVLDAAGAGTPRDGLLQCTLQSAGSN